MCAFDCEITYSNHNRFATSKNVIIIVLKQLNKFVEGSFLCGHLVMRPVVVINKHLCTHPHLTLAVTKVYLTLNASHQGHFFCIYYDRHTHVNTYLFIAEFQHVSVLGGGFSQWGNRTHPKADEAKQRCTRKSFCVTSRGVPQAA